MSDSTAVLWKVSPLNFCFKFISGTTLSLKSLPKGQKLKLITNFLNFKNFAATDFRFGGQFPLDISCFGYLLTSPHLIV